MSTAAKPKHIGRNITRVRELKGMKQEALAMAIGVTQQTVSNLEASETVEESKLVEVAKALGVTVEAIKNFSEEGVFNYFNTFNDSSSSQGNSFNQGMFPSFNPLDKVVELYERLVLAEKELVKAEKEKIEYLERVLKEK